MLTNEEYVAMQGNKCPACLSVHVRSDSELQHDVTTCWQDCKCDSCDAEWTDEYNLTSYSTPNRFIPEEVEDDN